jgi:hypothetical protein
VKRAIAVTLVELQIEALVARETVKGDVHEVSHESPALWFLGVAQNDLEQRRVALECADIGAAREQQLEDLGAARVFDRAIALVVGRVDVGSPLERIANRCQILRVQRREQLLLWTGRHRSEPPCYVAAGGDALNHLRVCWLS